MKKQPHVLFARAPGEASLSDPAKVWWAELSGLLITDAWRPAALLRRRKRIAVRKTQTSITSVKFTLVMLHVVW